MSDTVDTLGFDPSSDAQVKSEYTIALPINLNAKTKELVCYFAEALAEKLRRAEEKYGYNDGWRSGDWMDECRAKLREHLEKGDPRDVAAYCAFLYYHGESTNGKA